MLINKPTRLVQALPLMMEKFKLFSARIEGLAPYEF